MSNWQELIEQEGHLPAWPWPIRYYVENEISTDVLVLGGGIAGCHAAINAARKGAKVIICDIAHISISGQGGDGVDHWQMACTNPCCKITPEEMTDAVIESYGGYDCGIKRYIECKESYDTLLDVEKMGVQVRDVTDEFKGAEFRDEKTKLMFCYDYENKFSLRVCGSAMKPSLYKELKRLGVNILNWVRITSLLTERGKPGARVIGATAVNVRTGEFYILKAKATVSCMGNVRHLWVFSTELKGAADTLADLNNSGTSYATAWNAGAELALMETTMRSAGGFAYPVQGSGHFGATWYACNMVDANGKEIPWIDKDGRVLKTLPERYRPAPGQKFFLMGGGAAGTPPPGDPMADTSHLGPKLIPDLAERIRNGEFTPPLYADLPSMPPLERRAIWGLMIGAEGKTRYAIYENYGRAGFDPDKDMLQATIATSFGISGHSMGPSGWLGIGFDSGGGIVIDWDLKTTLDGLFVAGNPMLGGSNHTQAATSGRYAGRKAAEYARTAPDPVVYPDQVKDEKARVYAPIKRSSGIGWKELHAGIARIMQDYCGEERHEAVLKTGLRYFKEIRESEAANAYARNPHELLRILDCMDRMTSGEMIIHASMARKASNRWINFKRIDYPEADPKEWKKWVTIKQKDGKVEVGELPINYWLLPPNAPTYQENYEHHCGLSE